MALSPSKLLFRVGDKGCDEMKADSCECRIEPVPTDIREMLIGICFEEKCSDTENARYDQDNRTRVLKDPCTSRAVRPKVASKQQIQKRQEQDVNVTGTNENSKVLGNNIFIRKIDSH